MKKGMLLGTLLFTTVIFNTKGQATNSTSGTRNGTIPSTSQNGLSGTSNKTGSGVPGSSATIGGKSDNQSTSNSTVDGSTHGSATNDGASGQSGSPIANQSAAIDQHSPQTKTNAGSKLKTSHRKMIHGHSSKKTRS